MELRVLADRVYDSPEQNRFQTVGLPGDIIYERPLFEQRALPESDVWLIEKIERKARCDSCSGMLQFL